MKYRTGTITIIFVCACSGKVMDIGSNLGGGAGASANGVGAAGASSAGSSPGGQAGATGGEIGGAGGGAGAAGDGVGIGGSSGGGGCPDGFACGAGVDVGTSGGAGAIPPWPSDANCQSGVQLPIVGVWDGYVENLAFASGSDAVHVTITAANDTEVCGHVAWGQGVPPPPPTDPNVGYPPSFVDASRNGGAAGAPGFEVAEGFPMTVLNGHATSARVQFQVAQKEFWRAWCEMQTPYPAQARGDLYLCVPNIGWTGVPNGCALSNGQPIDCAKLELCNRQICACTASGCTVSPAGDVNFDLHVQTADKLTGSATLMGLHNVYLDRAR
jgi:hypothetical protein